MVGINTNVGGGVYRTMGNMSEVNKLMQKSLERMETGNKVNLGSDNPTVFAKVLEIDSDINAINTQISSNEEILKDLDKIDVAQTQIGELYAKMKDAAQALKNANISGDDDAKATHLVTIEEIEKSIELITANTLFNDEAVLDNADDTEELIYGTNTTPGTGVVDFVTHQWRDLNTDAALVTNQDATITAGIAALAAGDEDDAQDLIEDIDAVLANVADASASMAATKNDFFGAAQKRLTAELSSLSDFRSSLMSVNEAEESSLITNLQMRQQSMVTSLGIQNAFSASTLDLLG